MTTATQPATSIEGIVPVMLTPFDASGAIDYAGLERLIEWYIAHGSDALFAVAQSSEMQFLSLAERGALGRFVVEKVADDSLKLTRDQRIGKKVVGASVDCAEVVWPVSCPGDHDQR